MLKTLSAYPSVMHQSQEKLVNAATAEIFFDNMFLGIRAHDLGEVVAVTA